MILEYEYLVGFEYISGSVTVYYITEESFKRVDNIDKCVFEEPKENIQCVIIYDESMVFRLKDGHTRFFINLDLIFKLKEYYIYNKRKSIIESL